MALEPLDIHNESEVLALLTELTEDGKKRTFRYLQTGQRNEAYYHGQQLANITPADNSVVPSPWEFLPQTTQNQCRNLVNTKVARLLRGLPDVQCWPTHADPISIASADTANKLWRYKERRMNFDAKLDKSAKTGSNYGLAGFKICFYPEENDTRWDNISIMDFYLDPRAEDYTTANWVIFRQRMDKYDAVKMFRKAGIKEEDPPVSIETRNQYDPNELPEESVIVFEIWFKPSARITEGLFCKVCGQHVFDAQPYPYVFPDLEQMQQVQPDQAQEQPKPAKGKRKKQASVQQEADYEAPAPTQQGKAILPIVFFKVDERDGSYFGDTWVSDAIGEQDQINETEATIKKLRRQTGNQKLVVPDEPTAKAITAANQILIGEHGSIGYINPPVVPQILFADRDFHFKRMYDIAGLNEQLAGVDNVKSGTSAKQLDYLNQLDQMKEEGTGKSIQKMIKNGVELDLMLTQKYFIEERIMLVASDAGGFNTQAFRGADIQGITVSVEPDTGMDHFHASQLQDTQGEMQAGLLTQQQTQERMETGLPDTQLQEATRQVVQSQAKAVLQGAQVPIDHTLDVQTAQDEITRIYLALVERGTNPAMLVPLQQWRDAYAQGAAPAGPPPQGAPQMPGQPPMQQPGAQ